MKRKDKCVLRNYTFAYCDFFYFLKLRFSHNSNTVERPTSKYLMITAVNMCDKLQNKSNIHVVAI